MLALLTNRPITVSPIFSYTSTAAFTMLLAEKVHLCKVKRSEKVYLCLQTANFRQQDGREFGSDRDA